MNLLQTYSKATGLKIKNYPGAAKFYPLGTTKYITIQNSSAMPAKNWAYYTELITLLKPILEGNGISLIQIGGKGDQLLPGCINLIEQTTPAQTTYIIRGALVHLANDSFTSHVAGHNGVPQVTLFGPTSPYNHGPHFRHPRSIMVESHRRGNQPTFQSQESPRTIDFIPPEQVADAVVRALGGAGVSGFKTLNIGPIYTQTLFELAPDFIIDPNFYKDAAITIRMDYHFNENNLFNILGSGRKAMVVSDRPVDINGLVQFKNNVAGLSFEVTDAFTVEYLKQLTKTGLKARYCTKLTDKDKLFELRMKYFGICVIEQLTEKTKEDFIKAATEYTNGTVDIVSKMDNLVFKSNKYLMSKGQAFLSKAHWLANQPIGNFQENSQKVIDSPMFWQDMDFFYIYGPNL